MVVDAENGLSLEIAQHFGHGLVLVEGEIHTVSFCLPVWRVEIEERVGAVVFSNAFLPVEVFNSDVGGLPS